MLAIVPSAEQFAAAPAGRHADGLGKAAHGAGQLERDFALARGGRVGAGALDVRALERRRGVAASSSSACAGGRRRLSGVRLSCRCSRPTSRPGSSLDSSVWRRRGGRAARRARRGSGRRSSPWRGGGARAGGGLGRRPAARLFGVAAFALLFADVVDQRLGAAAGWRLDGVDRQPQVGLLRRDSAVRRRRGRLRAPSACGASLIVAAGLGRRRLGGASRRWSVSSWLCCDRPGPAPCRRPCRPGRCSLRGAPTARLGGGSIAAEAVARGLPSRLGSLAPPAHDRP